MITFTKFVLAQTLVDFINKCPVRFDIDLVERFRFKCFNGSQMYQEVSIFFGDD